jgi:UDP-2,3-diacylglucosamine pyrophosphatase LpxH
MLIIVSDLHLCDSTSQENIDPEAFGLLLREAYDLARHYHAEELEIVFLGDIFDLLRTERWFVDPSGAEVDIRHRPWGSGEVLADPKPSADVLRTARAITKDIAARNELALRILRGETPDSAQPPCEVRRSYIPGNHDRLFLLDEEIRNTVRDALGLHDPTKLGAGHRLHSLELPRYGLVARHGHEWDVWNFERWRAGTAAGQYADEDYLHVPIGDPITTELVARLPFELGRALADTSAFKGTPALDRVCRRMRRIEDVRPLLAAFRWVYDEARREHRTLTVEQSQTLQTVLRDTVRRVACDFRQLEFYKQWSHLHHHTLWIDAAEKLDLVLALLDHVGIGTVGTLASHFTGLFDKLQTDDPCSAGASREALDAVGQKGNRFVVYGHTHEALQCALHVDATSDIYLNSGTWRAREFLTADQGGFIGWELFTYLVFVDRNEQGSGEPNRDGPAFVSWNGTRRIV